MKKHWTQRYAGWEKGLHDGDLLLWKPGRTSFTLPIVEGDWQEPPRKREPLQAVKRVTGIRAH